MTNLEEQNLSKKFLFVQKPPKNQEDQIHLYKFEYLFPPKNHLCKVWFH